MQVNGTRGNKDFDGGGSAVPGCSGCLTDGDLNDSTNGSTRFHGKVSVLLRWSAADPVSAAEIRRNDRIHATWQHNRNPFIDHPEWATSIWG